MYARRPSSFLGRTSRLSQASAPSNGPPARRIVKGVKESGGPSRRHPEAFGRGLADTLRTYASVLAWADREADATRIRQESEAMMEQRALEDSIMSSTARPHSRLQGAPGTVR